MKLVLFLVLITIMAVANAQTIKNNQVVLGKTDSINSKILGEKRKVWVYVPNGAAESKQRYPVVYLLDGDAHFASVTGMIQQLSEVNGNMICPDMIVVAILNTDRTRDLTPTNSLLDPDGKELTDFKTSGGGEKFTAFIRDELMPHIDSVYPVAPYKILIGHSFGGLTVMNIVVNHPELFNAYVAIDPSMWWDKKRLLHQAHEVLKQKKYEGKSLYLGIANTMPKHMDTAEVRKDTTGNTAHIRSILELADIFKSNTANGLNFAYKYYKDDNHSSVPMIAEYDALHFLFSYYRIPLGLESEMFDKKAQIDVASVLSNHYENISKHLGYKILPPEAMLNDMAYYYYYQGNMPLRAHALLALNLQNYPNSFSAYDLMGDYYGDQKDKAKAIEYYTRALKLKDSKDTKDKLAKLKGGK